MTPQRRPFATKAAFAAGLIVAAHLLAPARARAVQLFIEDAFVHRKNGNCIVENTFSGVPRFRCPPIPPASCSSIPANPLTCPGPSCNCPLSCPFSGGARCSGGNSPSTDPCTGVNDPDPACAGLAGMGNISNDPHLEFERQVDASVCDTNVTLTLPTGVVHNNVCNSAIFLCASIGYANNDNGASSTDVGVDNLSFEIFKFQNGTNPLDDSPNSAPPLRTFFIDAPGILPGGCTSASTSCPGSTNDGKGGPLGPFCVLWDGNINIQGEFGKSNGQYGFRIKAQTNQTGASGNIQITALRAYPSGATRDGDGVDCPGSAATGVPGGCIVSQKPVTVDVTNVHVVRSSPTLVGAITPVPVQPYNIFYRLSKDATMFMTINAVSNDPVNPVPIVRTILSGVPRVGEGVPDGTLTNGDSWNGRADNGDLLPPGVFLATLQAFSVDQYGADLSFPTTRQIGLDPLQVTDIRVQPLLEGATSLAVMNYTLTEQATIYIDVYPPATQICNLTQNVNNIPDNTGDPTFPPKQFQASTTGVCPPITATGPPTGAVKPIKRVVVQGTSRIPLTSFWDGRDYNGQLLPDGDYVFVIYAALPSQNGFAFGGNPGNKIIWTTTAKSGFWAVIRGFVGISQITVASTVVGSSPPVAGINPFNFRYSLSRDAVVNVRIFDVTGTNVVKTLVKSEFRPGQFPNQEQWLEPTNDLGLVIDSGTYMVQLTAVDPQFPVKVTTTTALFLVNPFRITDIQTTPLLTGASDLALITYQLSNSMNVGINIYPPGTYFPNINTSWPPCGSVTPGPCPDALTPTGQNAIPVFNLHGLRVGKLRITEQWDGRDPNGLLVPDGVYVFTIIAQSTVTSNTFTNPKFATDKVFGTLSIQRGQIIFTRYEVDPTIAQMFNSSNTIALHPFSINYSLTRQSSVTIQILNTNLPPQIVRNLVIGQVRQSGVLLTDVWDGRDDFSNFLPSGFYNVRSIATDIAAQNSQLSVSTAQVTISYEPLRLYDLAVTPIRLDSPGASIFYQVSEPMKVSVKVYAPGTSFDVNGNPSPPESISLIKRIVQVKDARREVESVWDGTNLQLQLVPDGIYKFKVVASTNIKAIDDLTGNVLDPTALSLDRPIDDIPVVRNASADPASDFEHNTFAYPNPAYGPVVNFSIYVPFQGSIKMKIHNIAGELVYERDLGEHAPSFTAPPVAFVWPKTNQAGRNVARGIYYVALRAEETLGSKQVLQTVKKVLIP